MTKKKKENTNTIIITEELKEEKIFEDKRLKLKEDLEKKQNEVNFRKYISIIRICKSLFHIQKKEVKFI